MARRIAGGLVIVLACAASSASQEPATADLKQRIRSDMEHLRALYLHLHQNPELSFHELKTAERLAGELRGAGFQVTKGVGGHGVVGVLKNGEGPVVMVRTDMDALPLEEQTGLAYASRVQVKDAGGKQVGVMHACGHDVHMTVWTGTARALAGMKDRWKGTLLMVGQPAEERASGARAMVADGLFTRFPRPDHALALHCKSDLDAGRVGTRAGFALANVDMVDVLVRGVGGHGAYPHTTKDPIVLACRIVVALQTLVSREISPLEPAVVTVGSIHGGTKHNIIPSEAKLELTCRSYSDAVREKILEGIRRIARGVALSAGIPEDRLPVVSVRDESTPATWNDPALTERLAGVFRKTLGEQRVVSTSPVMGGEDFAVFGRQEPKIPICIFWLGVVDPRVGAEARRTGRTLPSLHSPFFAPKPEPAIRTGVHAMSAAVLDLMKR